MPNKKISELPASGALTGAELVELVQGGINKQTTTQDIADLGGGGGTSIPFGSTSGTNTYTIAATPAVTAYTDGMLLHVRVAASSTGLVTLNFDSIGAKKLLDTDGSQATDGYLKAGVDYIVTYNSALDSAVGAFTVVNEIQHGVMNLRGVFAASGGLYPGAGGSGPAGAIRHGDGWIVSGTDTIGSIVLRAGDFIFTGVDAPGQTASNWYLIPGYASVNLKANTTPASRTGTSIQFDTVATYGTIASPESGNITYNSTGAVVGNVQLLIHALYNSTPTFGSEFVLLGSYTPTETNYIYMELLADGNILTTIRTAV